MQHSTRLLSAFAALLTTALLAGCAGSVSQAPSPGPNVDGPILTELGLDGHDVRHIVEALDAIALDERPPGIMSSVDATELVLSDADGHSEVLPLPKDEMYISIAPYLTTTHDCYYHSPTGCVGELQNVDVDLTVMNSATGEILLEGTRTTFDNGFVGFWLPRGLETVITVEYDGRTASTPLSTAGDDAQTCITTLPLTAP